MPPDSASARGAHFASIPRRVAIHLPKADGRCPSKGAPAVATAKRSGSDLLSRAVSRGVPSALEGLTSVFGMGTGGTPPM